MTATKVTYILNKLGYNINTWLGFHDVPVITLLQGANLLVHPDTMRLRFNTTKDLIEVVYGVETETGFTDHSGKTSGYIGDTFISFSEICSINTTVYKSSQGSYHTKFFGTKSKL